MFRLLIWIIPTLNIAWLAWAWWRAGRLPNPWPWRILAALFFLFTMGHLGWLMYARSAEQEVPLIAPSLAIAYVWHLLVIIPLSALILLGETAGGVGRGLRKLVSNKYSHDKAAVPPAKGAVHMESHANAPDPRVSRRDFLLASAVAAPPALTVITGLGGFVESRKFRIRRIDVDVPGLTPELDGLTITHVSDVHAGKFVDEKLLRQVADATNELRSDLILATGDLIDFSLTDLPGALDAIRRMDAPGGVHMCEGNHDLFQSRTRFEETVRSAGVGLLINQTETVRLRGRDVQISGLRWGLGDGAHDDPPRTPEDEQRKWQPPRDDAGATVHMETIKPNLDPDALKIVLAHHPHAFDATADAGITLTLAGHTHGGQLMLSENIGFGPAMYRYWSGLYRKNNSRLVVSNGVGNWLPLRINAPAELIHITLRRTAAA